MLLELSPVVADAALDPTSFDCRVFQRKPCEVRTTCQPASLLAMKEPGWSATIRDISQGGVCLHVPRRFEKGTPLAIELPGDCDHEASVVFVNVVHVKPLEGGAWKLGCRFVCELNDEEMQRLLQWDAGAARPDQAAAPVNRPAQPTPLATMFNAEAAENRILSNVHFQLALHPGSQIRCIFKRFHASQCWPLAADKILRLTGRRGDQAKWSLTVQLVAFKEEANAWHLQAKLLQAKSVSDLLQALGSSLHDSSAD